MKLQYLIAAALLLAPAARTEERYSGQGTVTAPFAVNPDFRTVMGVVGGGDAFLYRGLALQGEVGYLFSRRDFAEGFGVASVGPAYHFTSRRRSQKLVPFVDGGYTLAFRSGTASLWHVGGGATWWFHDRVGAQFGVRNYTHQTEHWLTMLRVGFAFR